MSVVEAAGQVRLRLLRSVSEKARTRVEVEVVEATLMSEAAVDPCAIRRLAGNARAGLGTDVRPFLTNVLT